MTPHKFKPGQIVRVVLWRPLGTPIGRYEIVRTLVPDANGNRYQVRNTDDNRERVVRESELA